MSKKEKIVIASALAAVVLAAAVMVIVLAGGGASPDARETESSSVIQTTENTSVSAVLDETTAESAEVPDPFAPANETVTAKELTNLRAEPHTEAAIVSELKNGEILLRTGVSDDGWSRLEYGGQTVYAITSYLTADLDYRPTELPQADIVAGNTFTPKSDSVTAKELVNLRALPTTDSEIVGTLSGGDFLERTAVSDKGWSRLLYNGRTVYAVTSYLSNEVVPPYVAPDGFDAVDDEVTAKSETNLRTAPTVEDSEIVYTLKNGEYVRRVAVNPDSGWSRLLYNGQTVYAVTSYLEVKDGGD